MQLTNLTGHGYDIRYDTVTAHKFTINGNILSYKSKIGVIFKSTLSQWILANNDFVLHE